MPSMAASSSVTSSWRPGSTSALSMTSLTTCVSPERRITLVRQGRTGCVTPSDWGASTCPHVVRCASPVAPLEPANATFHPAGAGALVSAAAPSSDLRCSTIAAPATAARKTRRWPKTAGTGVVWLRPRLRRRLVDEPDPQLAQLLRRDLRRRAAHGVEARLVLRKRDHVAQVRLAREHHDRPVDPERDSAMRRRSHRERVEQEPELRPLLVGAQRERVEHALLQVGLVDPERPTAELVPVHDEVVCLRQGLTGLGVEAIPPLLHGSRERVMDGVPAPLVLVPLEHRKRIHPDEGEHVLVDEIELAPEMEAQMAEHPRRHRPLVGGEEERLAGAYLERLELLVGQELRDRRTDLAGVRIPHEVGEALRAALLRDLLEGGELGAGILAWNADEANRLRAREHAELRSSRCLRRVLDLETEPRVRLLGAKTAVGFGERHTRKRRVDLDAEALAPDRGERPLDQHEKLLAVGEGHLDIELRDLLHAIGAEVLVPEADSDLVVAVEARHHRQLLEDLGAL